MSDEFIITVCREQRTIMSVDMEFEFVAGARRNCELVYTPHDKQLYKYKAQYKTKKNQDVKRYICYQPNCKAAIAIINQERCSQRISSSKHAEHPNQELQMKEYKLKKSIKEEVAKPTLQKNKVRNVFNAECRKSKDSADLVVFKKMQRNLRRIKVAAMPKAPQKPTDFIEIFGKKHHMKEYGMCESIPEQPFYQTTILETDFQYTVFCSLPIASVIKNIESDDRHYLTDATFSVVPLCGYKQLLIIYFGYQRHVSSAIFKYVFVDHELHFSCEV